MGTVERVVLEGCLVNGGEIGFTSGRIKWHNIDDKEQKLAAVPHYVQ